MATERRLSFGGVAELALTHSDHLALADGPRRALLEAISDVLEHHGDRIEMHYRTRLLWGS